MLKCCLDFATLFAAKDFLQTDFNCQRDAFKSEGLVHCHLAMTQTRFWVLSAVIDQ